MCHLLPIVSLYALKVFTLHIQNEYLLIVSTHSSHNKQTMQLTFQKMRQHKKPVCTFKFTYVQTFIVILQHDCTYHCNNFTATFCLHILSANKGNNTYPDAPTSLDRNAKLFLTSHLLFLGINILHFGKYVFQILLLAQY